MANDVIAADAKLSNAYMAVKIAAEVAALILTVRMIHQIQNGPDPAAVFWDRVRNVAQRTALQVGRIGIYAECRYKEIVK